MKPDKRVQIALLALRLTVFLVMLIWTVDKFVRPEHAAAVLSHFYALAGFGTAVVYILAVLEVILLAAFVSGFMRRYSYGLVLLLHAATTVVSWREYMHPFMGANLLFFAAWPMLAACLALYLLREYDTLTVDGMLRRN
ncbi:MAG: hypothetical protein ACRER1_07900 [Gammaproteobacteria bacterium]